MMAPLVPSWSDWHGTPGETRLRFIVRSICADHLSLTAEHTAKTPTLVAPMVLV